MHATKAVSGGTEGLMTGLGYGMSLTYSGEQKSKEAKSEDGNERAKTDACNKFHL